MPVSKRHDVAVNGQLSNVASKGTSMSGSSFHLPGYLIAAAGVVLAGLSRWWLTPLIGDSPPMRLMLVVIVGAAAWLSGFGPALFATILGLLAIVLANDAPGDWPTLWARLWRFGSLAVLISVLFKWLNQSRRQAHAREQEFLRSEARYRRLIETAGQGIWVIDQAGRTTYANPRLGEILGIPPARLIGMALNEILVDDSASWNAADTQPDPFAWHEVRLHGGGGRICHAIVTSRAIGPDEMPTDASPSDGNTAGSLLIMVTDVTPLKETEEALREKESVLRSFYESSVMAMGVVQLTKNDTHFVSANALTDKFLGVAPGALEGMSASARCGAARDAEDVERAISGVPGDGPAGSIRVPGHLPKQPEVGLGYPLADGVAPAGSGTVLVRRRRHHRSQTDRRRAS